MHSGEGTSSPASPASPPTSAAAARSSIRERRARLVAIPRRSAMHVSTLMTLQAIPTGSSASPRTTPSGAARSTLRSLRTRGSCKPRCCLLSKNASSTLQRRQWPRMRDSAVAVGSVATSTHPHCPSGSRIRTTTTGSGLAPAIPRRCPGPPGCAAPVPLGKGDGPLHGRVVDGVLDHRLGRRQPVPFLARPAPLAARGRRTGQGVQRRLPVQRADRVEVLGPALEGRGG